MPESLGATLTQELRSDLSGSIDKNIDRPSNYGAINLFRKQTNSGTGIFSPRTKELIKNSQGNTVKIPYLTADDITIKNFRTCDIQRGGSKSSLITLTFGTYSFGFHMLPAQYWNNMVDYEADFKKKLTKAIQKFAKQLDSLLVGVLETNKNQYFPADITKFYTETGDALRVPLADKELFYNRAAAIMQTMDFSENVDVLTTPFGMSDIRHWNNQGQANDENLAYQFGSYSFFSSNRVTDGSGVQSTHYLVAPDTVAMETRIDRDARMGHSAMGGGKKWDSVVLPILNIEAGLYYTEDCTDATVDFQDSGLSDMQRTKIESFEWSFDLTTAVAVNPTPTTDYSPIVKAEFLAA
jgi:hypothetical protein